MPGAGELVIMANPDAGSSLRYLLRLPIAGGLVFRTAGTWPRTKALFCFPMPPEAWPDDGEVVERVPLRSCVRRGAAIEVVAERENGSQLVFTTGRGREMVFWQSPRTVKPARPNVALPTARAGGLADLEIIVDTRERYAYRFAGQAVTTVSRALPCGDYGVVADGRLVAAVERKSLPDLVSSVTNGKPAMPWATSPTCPGPPWWSRTATRRCSSSATPARPPSPTPWPSTRFAGRPSRSSSAKPAP